MTPAQTALTLKIISVLWIVWGAVHAFAGIVTIAQPASASIAGIADAVDPSVFHETYAAATDALINQHGFNLLWIGLFTLVGGAFIWRANATWLAFTAVVGGLTDVGYFLFIDLGGFVHFVPGTVMTLISGSAIVLSVFVYISGMTGGEPAQSVH
ncbi:MAG: hypothetical protein AAFU59_09425 [Pseudomonadota bacterium]